MILRLLECVLGLTIAVLILRDVFDTVVVPGGSRASLKVARRTVKTLLPIWKAARGRRRGVSTGFAPTALLTAFVIWMLLLVFGFGLMVHGLGDEFTPRIDSLAQAIYVAASALGTIGVGGAQVQGLARWVVVGGGFCGLAVVTMAVTYLLEIQGSTAHRDTGIMKIATTAGDPPSGLALLERYAALGCEEELAGALRSGREWCAGVLQSHASHPSLIYFRSSGTGAGWPATLGALLDAALIVELLLDLPDAKGAAVLLRNQAERLVIDVTEIIGLERKRFAVEPAEGRALRARLKAAGYPVRRGADLQDFIGRRVEHASCVRALADHLGMPEAPLVPKETA